MGRRGAGGMSQPGRGVAIDPHSVVLACGQCDQSGPAGQEVPEHLPQSKAQVRGQTDCTGLQPPLKVGW